MHSPQVSEVLPGPDNDYVRQSELGWLIVVLLVQDTSQRWCITVLNMESCKHMQKV